MERRTVGKYGLNQSILNIFIQFTGTGWVARWGQYSNEPNETYVAIDKLMEIHDPIITVDECNKRIRDQGFKEVTDTDLLTSTREENNKGVCRGDWGSPLFLIKNESYMVQVGIFSVSSVFQEMRLRR